MEPAEVKEDDRRTPESRRFLTAWRSGLIVCLLDLACESVLFDYGPFLEVLPGPCCWGFA